MENENKTNVTSTELAAAMPSMDLAMSEGMGAYCSLDMSKTENKKRIYNVLANSADETLSDHINEKINLTDIYIESVECKIRDSDGKPTGQTEIRPRIVLFDDIGRSYGCVSKGIYKSLADLVRVFGMPEEWTEPMGVIVRQKSTKAGKISVLELA